MLPRPPYTKRYSAGLTVPPTQPELSTPRAGHDPNTVPGPRSGPKSQPPSNSRPCEDQLRAFVTGVTREADFILVTPVDPRRTVTHRQGGREWSGVDDFGFSRHPGVTCGGPKTSRGATEQHGQALAARPVQGVGDLDVHVRLGAVAGISAFADLVAGPHRSTRPPPRPIRGADARPPRTARSGRGRSPPGCRRRRRSRRVPGRPVRARTAAGPAGICGQRGRSRRRARPPRSRMPGPGSARRTRRTVRGLRGQHRPPTPGARPAAGVNSHEVDRVGDAEQPRPVRRHPAGRAVPDRPGSAEGQVEHDRLLLAHRPWARSQSRTTGTADSTETWPSRGRSHNSPVGQDRSIAWACETGTIRSSSPCTNQAGTVSELEREAPVRRESGVVVDQSVRPGRAGSAGVRAQRCPLPLQRGPIRVHEHGRIELVGLGELPPRLPTLPCGTERRR